MEDAVSHVNRERMDDVDLARVTVLKKYPASFDADHVIAALACSYCPLNPAGSYCFSGAALFPSEGERTSPRTYASPE
jgi:hypothetical protein